MEALRIDLWIDVAPLIRTMWRRCTGPPGTEQMWQQRSYAPKAGSRACVQPHRLLCRCAVTPHAGHREWHSKSVWCTKLTLNACSEPADFRVQPRSTLKQVVPYRCSIIYCASSQANFQPNSSVRSQCYSACLGLETPEVHGRHDASRDRASAVAWRARHGMSLVYVMLLRAQGFPQHQKQRSMGSEVRLQFSGHPTAKF